MEILIGQIFLVYWQNIPTNKIIISFNIIGSIRIVCTVILKKSMNKRLYITLTILFGFISFGATSETHRIMTYSSIDFAPQRMYLTNLALMFLISLLLLTRYFCY